MGNETSTAVVAAVAAAATGLLGEPLSEPRLLGGSTRSVVVRLRRADGSSVVVKRFVDDDPVPGPYDREAMGLELLDHTPHLLARDDATRTLVMSDAGEHPTLADLLRGDDADDAWAGAVRWARALGELCGGSTRLADEVAARLPGVLGEDPQAALRERLTSGVAALAGLGATEVTPEVEAELDRLAAVARRDGTLVVSPGDTCPDNVLLGPDGGVTFIDLEGTDAHPLALDAAYAMLPFATCWCVYGDPDGFTEAMLAAFTDGVRATAPQLLGADWDAEVAAASVAFVLVMASVLLKYTDDAEDRLGPPTTPALTFREHLLRRFRRVLDGPTAAFPAVHGFLVDVLAHAEERWGALDVPTYPAFRAVTVGG